MSAPEADALSGLMSEFMFSIALLQRHFYLSKKTHLQKRFLGKDYIYINGSYCLALQCHWIVNVYRSGHKAMNSLDLQTFLEAHLLVSFNWVTGYINIEVSTFHEIFFRVIVRICSSCKY